MGRKRNSLHSPQNRERRSRGKAASADAQRAGRAGPVRENEIAPPLVLGARARRQTRAVCALLVLSVALVFGQTLRHGFVNIDDGVYVTENPYISHGLTPSGVAWAFTQSQAGNWHPLTGLSHMLDCQIYGLGAGGHHLTSVLLHAATAVLLFLVLSRMTGNLWPSAVVAALFAVHPLRAESVAWVSERKDVLSGLCFMLTLGAYVWFVRGPASWKRYLLLLVVRSGLDGQVDVGDAAGAVVGVGLLAVGADVGQSARRRTNRGVLRGAAQLAHWSGRRFRCSC